MKVLVICGAGIFSGKEKIMLSLLFGLKEQGYDPFCITSSWNDGMFINSLIEAGIPYKKLRIGFISFSLKFKILLMTLEQLLYIVPVWFLYSRFIRQHKPSIVIHTNYHHAILLSPILSRKQLHVYHSHESIRTENVYKKIFKIINKKMSYFVGVSNFVCNRIELLGIPKEKIVCIHNGLEIKENFSRFEINQRLVKIGVIGQIGQWKGHEDVIDALEVLNTEKIDADYVCLIFGKGSDEYEGYLKRKISEKKLMARIIWMGYEKDIERIYNDLDIVCVVSRSEEPFATTALEAANFSIPLIVSNKGGLPEIVTNGENGFIVEAQNHKQLAVKIKLLLENGELRKQMGITNHQMLQQRYSHQQFIENWINLFNNNWR